MFDRKRKRQMAMVQNLTPISKASLKRQCLIIAEGDLKRAKEYYDFWVDGLEGDLPAFDPVKPNWMDSLGARANALLAWAKDNKDVLAQGADMITNLIGRRGVTAVAESAEALEEINE